MRVIQRIVPAFVLIAVVGMPLFGEPALDYGSETVRNFGVILTASKWLNPKIEVCWEDMADSSAADRAVVQKAVEASWAAHSKVEFLGWGVCREGQAGIHVAVRDETPQALQLGRYLSGRPSGITLNFTFVRWKPVRCTNRSSCIQAIAVHEFGHGLGFSHEQNRGDRPDWCKEETQGAEGDFFVTSYDDQSIMNYCNAEWTGQGGLSARDIEAIGKIYGV